MNPTHKALRDGTADAHARVDAAFAGFDLADKDSYARFLMAHAELVWPLEATLPGERVVDDWEERKRGHLLKEDLAQLPRHPRAGGDPGPQTMSSATLDPRLRGDDGKSMTGEGNQKGRGIPAPLSLLRIVQNAALSENTTCEPPMFDPSLVEPKFGIR